MKCCGLANSGFCLRYDTGLRFIALLSEKTHVSSLQFLCGTPHKKSVSTNFKVFGLTRRGLSTRGLPV